ncbi:hypothetical protein JCM17823_28250 [Halorubrum gandharaense]
MTVVAGVSPGRDEEKLLREAARLADGVDEALHVTHVVSESAFEEPTADADGTPTFGAVREEARQVAVEAATEALGDDAAISPDGESFEAVGLVGEPADELIEYANHVDASLLAVGGRERSPVGKAVFGSVTQTVLFEAGRPVVTCFCE